MSNSLPKIVIVDDSVAFSTALKFLFDTCDDVEIKVYHTAADFLNEYTADWWGCILMDLFIPGMDGMELLEELRVRGNQMYMIMISGHADNATALIAKEKGAHEFIPKPFDPYYVLEKVKYVCSSKLQFII